MPSSSLAVKPDKMDKWSNFSGSIIVGKDILELLSSSMYVDPMSIYREYVQNAADSIDEAREKGLLSDRHPGRVDLSVDSDARTVRIRDNGTGIKGSEFVKKMTSFGASTKRGNSTRGFRGVGRLAGIGYCQELVFRSRSVDDSDVSELSWDCRKLKTILRANDSDGHLNDVVKDSVSVRKSIPKGYPEHFFEVELRGIIRHKNDQLLNPNAIDAYLSQVAPVPFAPEFRFRSEITEHLTPHIRLGDLEIRLSPNTTPICRPYRNGIELGPNDVDEFNELQLLTFPGIDSEVAAVGWILHHGYTGAFSSNSLLRGVRLRVGNIQVGDDRLLEDLFSETRFNGWSVGEIHIIEPRIVPNGRRDHFEQNMHFHTLLTHIAPVARDISRRCRTSSIRRNRWREILRSIELSKDKLKMVKQGSLAKAEQIRLLKEIHDSLATAEKRLSSGELFTEELKAGPIREIQKLKREVTMLESQGGFPTALANVPKAQVRVYQRVFSLIYECSPNQNVAKGIIDRIMEKLR